MYKIAILLMVLAVISEYVYYFLKKKQERNLAKNILGDILIVAGLVIFWSQFPRHFTTVELVLQGTLEILYFGTIGWVAVKKKPEE